MTLVDISGSGQAQEVVRMAGALKDLWLSNHSSESAESLDRILSRTDARERSPLRAESLLISGYLHLERGDLAKSKVRFEESLDIARHLGDQAILSRSLGGLSVLARRMGDLSEGLDLADESVRIARATEDMFAIAEALNRRGEARAACGKPKPDADFSEALEWFTKADDRLGMMKASENLASYALKHGDVIGARSHIETALRSRDTVQDRAGVLESFVIAGLVSLLEHEITEIHTEIRDPVINEHSGSIRSLFAYALLGMASCAQARGDEARAGLFQGAAETLIK